MAVFTELSRAEIEHILCDYSVGGLVELEPVASGVENTNYFISTKDDRGLHRWVLTLFENIDSNDLPYFCELLTELARHRLAVPSPEPRRAPPSWFWCRQRPGILAPRLSGVAVMQPDSTHCYAIGRWLGTMHQALAQSSLQRSPPRDAAWFESAARSVEGYLESLGQDLMRQLMCSCQQLFPRLSNLPQRLIHGDLFRDNALFEGSSVSGVIDFYHGCRHAAALDLAIMMNDWCFDRRKGAFDESLEQAMLQGYQSMRKLEREELECWPALRVMAAGQFWLSRLKTRYLQGYQSHSSVGQVFKDPAEMEQMLVGLLAQTGV